MTFSSDEIDQLADAIRTQDQDLWRSLVRIWATRRSGLYPPLPDTDYPQQLLNATPFKSGEVERLCRLSEQMPFLINKTTAPQLVGLLLKILARYYPKQREFTDAEILTAMSALHVADPAIWERIRKSFDSGIDPVFNDGLAEDAYIMRKTFKALPLLTESDLSQHAYSDLI